VRGKELGKMGQAGELEGAGRSNHLHATLLLFLSGVVFAGAMGFRMVGREAGKERTKGGEEVGELGGGWPRPRAL